MKYNIECNNEIALFKKISLRRLFPATAMR